MPRVSIVCAPVKKSKKTYRSREKRVQAKELEFWRQRKDVNGQQLKGEPKPPKPLQWNDCISYNPGSFYYDYVTAIRMICIEKKIKYYVNKRGNLIGCKDFLNFTNRFGRAIHTDVSVHSKNVQNFAEIFEKMNGPERQLHKLRQDVFRR